MEDETDNMFELDESPLLFDTKNLSFNNHEKNNILNLIDKINKIAYSRNCKDKIAKSDVKLCHNILHSNKQLPEHNTLDYNQKMILKRLLHKNSVKEYSNSAFNEFCKLSHVYNNLNKHGNNKVFISQKNPKSYVLGNQIGFLLNEANKKIYRLENDNNNLCIQNIVDLRKIKKNNLSTMQNIPVTYFSDFDRLQNHKLKLGDHVDIQTNSNKKHKCIYFDSIGNCINYCRIFKRA